MAKKSNVVNVDFTGVSEGGGFRIKPGDYAVKVKKVEHKISDKDKPYFNWELEVLNGDAKGKKLFHTTSLQPQALFNLRNTLLACKMNVPKSKMSVDIKKLVGAIMGVTVDDDEYKGKVKSSVVDVFPISIKKGKMIKESLGETDEFDQNEDDLEGLDEEEGIDTSEMDLDELLEFADDNDIEIPKKAKKSEDKVREIIDAWLEEQEDEEEDEEVDYSEMSLKELKALCKEREITVPKKATEEDLISLLEEADEEENDEEEENDYSDLTLKELKALCKERGIKVTSKDDEDSLIEKLEADDED